MARKQADKDAAAPARPRGRARMGVLGAALITAVASALLWAPISSAWVEAYYSRSVYPFIQSPLTWLSNFAAVPVGEIALAVIMLGVVIGLIRAVLRPRERALRFIVGVVALAGAGYIAMVMTWGLNYRRVPLNHSPSYDSTRVNHAALRALAERAVSELNAIYPRLPARWPELGELRDSLAPAFRHASALVGGRALILARPKQSLVDIGMRRSAVAGYILPYFGEIMINSSMLPFQRPAVVAHEWGHLAGRANESEASYVAWLTGMHGPLWARYSAWVDVYGYLMRALPASERSDVTAKLDAGPRRDFQAADERYRRDVRPAASRVQQAVNDRYLKANGVTDGVRSYSLVVRLMLGMRIPVPELPKN